MKNMKCRGELQVAFKSLILLLGFFLVLWIPFRLAVRINYSGLINARAKGGRVAASSVKKYEQSLDNAFYIPFGSALLLSQSAVWLAAVTKRKETDLEHEDSNRPADAAD